MRKVRDKFSMKTLIKLCTTLPKCGQQLLELQVSDSYYINLAPINREYISNIFNQMANGKAILTVSDFCDYMRG